jgi:acyl carrier protein
VATAPWPDAFVDTLRAHVPLLRADTSLDPDAALADYGLNSLKMVSLLIALEDQFLITVPDELLIDNSFENARSLWSTIQQAAVMCGVTIANGTNA